MHCAALQKHQDFFLLFEAFKNYIIFKKQILKCISCKIYMSFMNEIHFQVSNHLNQKSVENMEVIEFLFVCKNLDSISRRAY